MSHFEFVYHEDGSERIKSVLKDGQIMKKGVRLEMPNAIVQTYFKAAVSNLRKMTCDEGDRDENRLYGIQAFLMSLTGLEAFCNVFFHLASIEKGLPKVNIALNDKTKGVTYYIKNLTPVCYGSSIPNIGFINRKITDLYNLRNDIVHPKWEPASLNMGGVAIESMADNFQAVFESREYVREALRWCLLAIARVGNIAAPQVGNGFMLRWTSLSDSNETLSEQLGISPNGAANGENEVPTTKE